MTPKSLAQIPAALEITGETSALDLSVGQFIESHWYSPRVVNAVRTVAGILRIDRLRNLCTDEAEGLLANRYSSGIARQVIDCLWKWLLTHAAGPGPRLADAASERNGIVPHEVETGDDDGDEAGYDDGHDEDDAILLHVGNEPDSSADAQHLHLLPPPKARESLPAVEAPPQNGEALDRWADRYGVKERLADQLDLDHLRRSHYGFAIPGLPGTIREAVLVTPASLTAPKYLRSTLASQLVGMAKSHLHRAAQAVAIAQKRQAERAARTRPLDDPFLLRFEDLVRRQRDLLSATAKPRPAGTFLPGRIYVSSDALALTYREWDVSEGRTPNIEGETMFFLHLSAWDGGELRLECKRCREPSTCPHRATVLQECLEALHDPADPLSAALAPLLRVPGWSRLLDHLDAGLGKIAPVAGDEGQRLVWQVVSKHGKLAVHPVRQRLGKRGTWGRGQRLKLDELDHNRKLLRDVADREAFEGLVY